MKWPIYLYPSLNPSQCPYVGDGLENHTDNMVDLSDNKIDCTWQQNYWWTFEMMTMVRSRRGFSLVLTSHGFDFLDPIEVDCTRNLCSTNGKFFCLQKSVADLGITNGGSQAKNLWPHPLSVGVSCALGSVQLSIVLDVY